MDLADSATDEFDRNLALASLTAGQDSLHDIDAAISRILNGSYGVCEETGKPIPAARLKAIPWTRFAREVEARHETAGEISPPHLGPLGSVRGDLTGNLEPIKSDEETDSEESPATDEAVSEHRGAAVWAASEVGKRRRPPAKRSGL